MRKINFFKHLVALIAMVATFSANAQSVANYVFQNTTGTYVGTTGQTQIHGASNDEGMSGNLNIGFDF